MPARWPPPFCLSLGIASAQAEESAVAKAAAWKIGDQLSLAGLLYSQGGEEENVKELLDSVKPLTDAMKIEVKPFPPRGETPVETYAAVIEYLIKGDGAEIGRKIGEQFGKNAGLLFEISVKSNLLILLYEPGDDQGIGSVIQVALQRDRSAEQSVARCRQRGERQGLQGRGEERRVQDARRRRDLSQSAGPVMLSCLWMGRGRQSWLINRVLCPGDVGGKCRQLGSF